LSRSAIRTRACALAFLCAAAAHGEPLDGRALRIKAGLVRPEAAGNAAWLGAGVVLRAGPLWLEPELGYWARHETGFGLESSVRDFHAGVNASFTLLRRGRARLSPALGGAVHRVTSSGGPLGGATESETQLRPGLLGSIELELRLGPRSAAFVGGRSDWIPRRAREDERETRLYAGLRLAF
jgi:hypothetical protein